MNEYKLSTIEETRLATLFGELKPTSTGKYKKKDVVKALTIFILLRLDASSEHKAKNSKEVFEEYFELFKANKGFFEKLASASNVEPSTFEVLEGTFTASMSNVRKENNDIKVKGVRGGYYTTRTNMDISRTNSNVSRNISYTSMSTHIFPLSKDIQVKFDLPSDLSKRDAERLSKFIESLAYHV